MKTAVLNTKNSSVQQQWPQYLAVLTACIIAFVSGLQFSWPSPSLPMMKAKNSSYHITSEEESYIAIIGPIGNMLGAPLAAAIADVIGRKYGILLIALPLFIGWIIIVFAKTVVMFCVSRFISGIGDGMIFIFIPMYIGEVTEPNVRGVLGCSISVTMLIGMLSINVIAPYMSIVNTALLCSVTPVIFIFAFMWMPESPYYLVMRDRLEDAKKSLGFLRNSNVDKEFEVLVRDVKRQTSELGTMKELFTIKSNRKALYIMLGVRCIQQLSGSSATSIFTQKIFAQAGGNLSPALATMIFLMVQLLVTCFGSVMVEKYGRRIPFIGSCLSTGIILILIGTYFYIHEYTYIDTTNLQFLAVVLMLIFITAYSIGLGTVPTLMLGELFSASIKSKALCIMCIFYSGMISLTAKLFHFLDESLGIHIAFYAFGCLCVINSFISYFFVPETKGKSLEDIQQYLKGNKNNTKENGI